MSSRSTIRRILPAYCCAITMVMAAGLHSALTPFGTVLLFLPAVVMSAQYAGILAGLETAALSALASAFFFLPPAWSLAVGRIGAMEVACFLLAAAAVSLRMSRDTVRGRSGSPQVGA